MWQFAFDPLAGSRGQKLTIRDAQGPLRYAAFLELLARHAAFRDGFNSALAAAPYNAYKWETPPVSSTTLTRDFECVLLESPWLDTAADPTPFMSRFEASGEDQDALAFENLGGDALMVVPVPSGATRAYAHLGAFVRDAPARRRHGLWSLVGRAMLERMGPAPIWLGTAGGGVAWLHVRLDSRPKYYGHAPYRKLPPRD